MIMADKNAFVLQDDCSYCGAQEKEEQQERVCQEFCVNRFNKQHRIAA